MTWDDSSERVAGALLLSGLLIGLLGLAILLASGAAAGFRPAELALMAPYAGTFRLLNTLYALAWLAQMPGLALLARLLVRGGEQLTVTALVLVLFGALAGFLHGTFEATVVTWAAQEAARTGSLPPIHAALDPWLSLVFGVGYRAHLAGTALFGWCLAREGSLAPGLGWAATGWSVLWLAASFLGVGVPALPILTAAGIGLGLLRRG